MQNYRPQIDSGDSSCREGAATPSKEIEYAHSNSRPAGKIGFNALLRKGTACDDIHMTPLRAKKSKAVKKLGAKSLKIITRIGNAGITEAAAQPAAIKPAALGANKVKGDHHHKHDENCEFCSLNDDKLAQAYRALKAHDANRKRAVQAKTTYTGLAAICSPDVTSLDKQPLAAATRKTIILGACALFFLCIVTVSFAVCKHSGSENPGPRNTREFISADARQNLTLSTKGATLSICGNRTSNDSRKIRYWQNDLSDMTSLLAGDIDNAVWLKSTDEGLETAEGIKLYDQKSPEFSVIQSMRSINEVALNMFRTQGHYPNDAGELKAAVKCLSNQSIDVYHEMGATLVTSYGETIFERNLHQGQKFGQDINVKPNTISCLEIKSEPVIASDMNSYGWKTNSFFVHGFDRNGKLINVSPDNTMLLMSKNGEAVGHINACSAASFNGDGPICIYSGNLPSKFALRSQISDTIIFFIILSISVYMYRMHRSTMEFLSIDKARN